MAHDLPRIHEPDYSDPKEPYAFYGLAAYYVQCFEQSLILTLVVLRAMGAKGIKGTTYDEVLATLDKETMGTLIGRLKKVATLEPELETRVGGLLHQRNYLIHHFFERNTHKLLSEAGRRAVLDELRQIAQRFQDADHAMIEIYEPLFAKFGIGEAQIQRALEEMQAGKFQLRDAE